MMFAGAQAASAHAQLLSTTPENGAVLDQSPAEAVLTFNEPVQLVDGSIRLFPGDGVPLTLDAHVSDTSVIAVFPADADDGAYALSYRVVSADGHPISGAITFTIGDTAGSPSVTPALETATPQSTAFAVSALTAVQYVSLLIFAGLILFEHLVLRNASPPERRTLNLIRITGIGAIAASAILIAASALNVTGEPIAAVIAPAAWWTGILWGPVASAIAISGGVIGASLVVMRGPQHRGTRLSAMLLMFLALAAPVLVGHTQLKQPRVLIIGADIGHLLAGSLWTGGVLGLLLFLASVRRTGTAPTLAVRVVQRFSRLAFWSVTILALSGTIMGIMIIGSLDALVTTSYGLTLLLKIGIVIPVVAIAAYNRHRLLPKVSARPTTRMQWQTLNRTLAYEAALLVAVLLLTGFLTNLSPAHEHHDTSTGHTVPTTHAMSIDADAQGLSLHGELSPALTGANQITFTLEYEGEPVAPNAVTIRTHQPRHDLGPFEVVAEFDHTTGEYSAPLDLPVRGEWDVRVLARISTFSQPIITIPVTID